MTPLEEIIAQVDALLLDFDGPLCRLFAGYPAGRAAEAERDLLRARGVDVPAEFANASDPLRLLQWTGTHHPALIPGVEERLLTAERMAVRSAAPTPHSADVLRSAVESGLRVGVVSNNSAPAINAYLEMHGLSGYVSAISGRVPGQLDLMKPNPHLVARASELLGVRTSRCVLVGDSATDMEAARSAGARSVGYAKAPGRVDVLADSGAEVVIEDMAILAQAIANAAREGEQRVWPIN